MEDNQKEQPRYTRREVLALALFLAACSKQETQGTSVSKRMHRVTAVSKAPVATRGFEIRLPVVVVPAQIPQSELASTAAQVTPVPEKVASPEPDYPEFNAGGIIDAALPYTWVIPAATARLGGMNSDLRIKAEPWVQINQDWDPATQVRQANYLNYQHEEYVARTSAGVEIGGHSGVLVFPNSNFINNGTLTLEQRFYMDFEWIQRASKEALIGAEIYQEQDTDSGVKTVMWRVIKARDVPEDVFNSPDAGGEGRPGDSTAIPVWYRRLDKLTVTENGRAERAFSDAELAETDTAGQGNALTLYTCKRVGDNMAYRRVVITKLVSTRIKLNTEAH